MPINVDINQLDGIEATLRTCFVAKSSQLSKGFGKHAFMYQTQLE